MATIEQLVRARAAINGEDPDAALSLYQSGLPVAPAPSVDPSGGGAIQPPQMPVAEPPMIAPAPPVAMPEPAPIVVQPPTQMRPGRPMQQLGASLATSDQAAYAQQKAIAEQEHQAARVAAQRDSERAGRNAQLEGYAAEDDARADEYKAEREAVMAKVRALDERIDSTKIRDSRTGWNKAAGILASVFGGVGDAINAGAGRNTNMEGEIASRIDKQVERDLAMQREELENMKDSRVRQLNQLGLARDALKDDQAANDYVRANLTERYLNAMGGIADKMSDAERRGTAKQAIATITLENEARRRQTLLQMAQEQRLGRQGGGGGGQRISPELAYRMEQDRIKRELEERDRENKTAMREVPGLVPAKPLEQISDRDAEAARSASKMYDQLQSNLQRMKELATTDYGPTAKDTFALLQQSTIAMATQAAGSGVPGATEAVEFAKGMPGPNMLTTWSLADREKVYDNAMENYRNLKRVAVKSYGYDMPKSQSGSGGGASGSWGEPEAPAQAAAPAQAEQPAAPSRARVRAPNGTVGFIDADKVEAAKKKGYEVLE